MKSKKSPWHQFNPGWLKSPPRDRMHPAAQPMVGKAHSRTGKGRQA